MPITRKTDGWPSLRTDTGVHHHLETAIAFDLEQVIDMVWNRCPSSLEYALKGTKKLYRQPSVVQATRSIPLDGTPQSRYCMSVLPTRGRQGPYWEAYRSSYTCSNRSA